jgi:hypothetical protein
MISCFTGRVEHGKVLVLRLTASGGAYNSVIPSQGTSTYRVCAASVGFSDLGFFFEEEQSWRGRSSVPSAAGAAN